MASTVCRGRIDAGGATAAFDFVFALFGLLLGLSMTEILAGSARAIEARLQNGAAVRIGWLTPLLGVFVLLDLLSFWNAAWVTRAQITVSAHVLLAVMLFTGAYYLAAALVFPREIAPGADLDAHFMRVRRIVVGMMLALLLCQISWYVSLPALAPRILAPLPLAMTAVLAVLMIAAMVANGRWCRYAMLALVARYLVIYLL